MGKFDPAGVVPLFNLVRNEGVEFRTKRMKQIEQDPVLEQLQVFAIEDQLSAVPFTLHFSQLIAHPVEQFLEYIIARFPHTG